MQYSVQPRDRTFVKSYEFLSFVKNIVKNISENLNAKYNQKLLDHAKQPAADALEACSKRVIQKTAEATDELIGNKIADSVIKVSKSSEQNNLETVTNEKDK